jgi:polar amino acid transport system substrate-binding protein
LYFQKLILKFVLILMSLATYLAPISAASRDENVLIAGANIGNVPWEFQDTAGELIGFEIDLVNEVAKRLNREIEIINIPFNGLFSAVQSSRIDIAISSITITEQRLTSVSFAQPYYDSDQSLTIRSDSNITSVNDLQDEVVAVDTGSTGDIWASENQQQYGFKEIRRYEGIAPAALDLQIGRVAGYISDIPAMQYYTKDKPELKVVERIRTGGSYSMMFRKDDELALSVNEIITTLKQEGLVNELHNKWFGVLAEESTSTAKVTAMPGVKAGLLLNFMDTFLNKAVFVETLPMLLLGLTTTLKLGLASIVIGLFFGLLLALNRLYAPAIARVITKVYINVFRSIPLLVLLIVIFYALPFVGISLSPFTAAATALIIVSSAYTAEIFRSGIEAIPKGQFEASQALGLSFAHMMKDVILPQATRIVIPPLTNNSINVIKDTALASVVAMPDLLKQATQAQAIAANPTPLIAAAGIYLLVLLPMVLAVSHLEKKYSKRNQ